MEWVTSVELKRALIRPAMQAEEFVNMVSARAAHGLLRAKAKHLINDEKEFGEAEIPKEFWSGGYFCLSGDWDVGDLIATLPRDTRGFQFKKIKAFGIRFSREDAEAMGAVFNPARSEAPLATDLVAPVEIAERPETVEEWAVRVVACNLKIGGFTAAILAASWRGPGDPPAKKVAEDALRREWARNGRTGPGNPGKR